MKADLKWVWDHTVPGQLSHLNLTIKQMRSGDYSAARENSAYGIRIGVDNLAIGLMAGGAVASSGIWAYRAVGVGKRAMKASRAVQPMIFKAHILKEAWDNDLEWQDIPYYAAPWVASQAWDRYVTKSKSSPAARRGNAVGPGGGTKTSKKKGKKTHTSRFASMRCRVRSRRGIRCKRSGGHPGRHSFK